ncbi:MAG: hypothetical protein JNM43_22330 [Planctomycetaceae bacterium]|nr:hypothetical protein [Planctomycetaceae bacterium]
MGIENTDFGEFFRVGLSETPDLIKEYLGMHIMQVLMDDRGFRAVFANQGEVACAFALLGFLRLECENVVRVLYSALELQAGTEFHDPYAKELISDRLLERISVPRNASFDMLTKEYESALQQDGDRILGSSEVRRWDDQVVCMLIDHSAMRFTSGVADAFKHPRLSSGRSDR